MEMEKKRKEKATKALLYWLRHHPTDIAISLNEGGWANVESLSINSTRKYKLSVEEVEFIVNNDDKNRFTLSENSKLIKANEGHSVTIS